MVQLLIEILAAEGFLTVCGVAVDLLILEVKGVISGEIPLKLQAIDELLLCFKRLGLILLNKLVEEGMELVSFAVEAVDAILLDIVLILAEQLLGVLQKVNEFVLLLAVGIGVSHVVVCEDALQLLRELLLEFLDVLYPPLRTLYLWHALDALILDVWMELGVLV